MQGKDMRPVLEWNQNEEPSWIEGPMDEEVNTSLILADLVLVSPPSLVLMKNQRECLVTEKMDKTSEAVPSLL